MRKESVMSNMVWRFMERSGAQLVSVVVSIVLARLLMPEVYGMVALVGVIMSVLQVFVDSGMGNALIQKKNADDLDFSTVFYFNMGMCILLYAALFFAAPIIADFYEQPDLTSVIRVLGITLIISGVKNVQQAYVSKYMMFRIFFFSTLLGTVIAAVVGIVMAVYGCGVWALVAQHLVNLCIDTLVLWCTVRWRPILAFSWVRLRSLFSYGSKLLVSALLDTVYNNLRQLIIGKKYSASDLAFYNRGQNLPSLVVSNINSSINSVLLPTMSAQQDDHSTVKAMTRRAIKTSSYIMWPMMIGLGVCAEPLVRVLLTDKWLPCIPYLRIFCFVYAFYPIHTCNLNAIKAMGRSDIFLRLEIEKKVIGLGILFATMWHGVMTMAYGLIVSTVTSSFINAHPNKKLLNYTYWEQIKDIFPSMLLAAGMGVVVWQWNRLTLSPFVTLLLQVPTGIVTYILGSMLLKIDSFYYLLPFVKKVIRKCLRK